jgi:ketosteroid isomerase-like protein
MDSPGRRFYQRQLALLHAGDIDGLIADQYCEDAVLISPERVVQGADALRTYFRGYLDSLGQFSVDSLDAFREAENAILFEATVTTEKGGRARVYDAFSLRDGKIAHHFTGVIQRL